MTVICGCAHLCHRLELERPLINRATTVPHSADTPIAAMKIHLLKRLCGPVPVPALVVPAAGGAPEADFWPLFPIGSRHS